MRIGCDGSAPGMRVMPKLVASPNAASPKSVMPAQAGVPSNITDNIDPPTVPGMMARNVPSSRMPLPHESRFSGSSSGNEPYLDGPKTALWTPMENTHPNTRTRFR